MAPIDVSFHATARPRVIAPDLEPDVNCAAMIGAPVLITAGADMAEWLGRVIHDRSSRSGDPFVVYRPGRGNQLTLLNSALNGGGPVRGTLFIAGVENISSEVQAHLRVLLAGIPPDFRVQFRIIAGTSVSLFERVERGEFDEWLFYHLNEIHIRVRTHERVDRRHVLHAANWSPLPATAADAMNVRAFRQHRVMLRSGLDAGTERTTTARRKSEH